MFDIVLYEPEIPPNTGNIIRLCANTGSHLHLIKPLGFELDNKKLRRAGLDYHEWADIQAHDTFDVFLRARKPRRVIAFSTKAEETYSNHAFQSGDALLFGPETRGLPDRVLNGAGVSKQLRVPMVPQGRSLNLSNAVALVVYEAWRQQSFSGCS